MICPNCGSNKVNITENMYTESKNRSFLWNAFMVLITGGLWIIWMLVRKKKEKTFCLKKCVCQNCSHSWELDKTKV